MQGHLTTYLRSIGYNAEHFLLSILHNKYPVSVYECSKFNPALYGTSILFVMIPYNLIELRLFMKSIIVDNYAVIRMKKSTVCLTYNKVFQPA